MSWSELERLVEDAESDSTLRGILRSCTSQEDLVLAARRRGYRITRLDLQRAAQEEQRRKLSGNDGSMPAAGEGPCVNPCDRSC